MPVSFSNNSKVRNLHLNPNVEGPAVYANNYTVPTKTQNGPSLVSNSKVQENYKTNPNNYKWTTSRSYANTFKNVKNSSTTKKFLKEAPGKFGNGWVNAVTLKNSHNETKAERNSLYKAEIKSILRKFGVLSASKSSALLDGLETLADLSIQVGKKKITTAKFDSSSEIVISEIVKNTGVPKAKITKNFPLFLEAFALKVKMNESEKKTQKLGLNSLLKSKKNANNLLKERNRNTKKLRASYAPNNNGRLSAPAELLSMAAKYGKPGNFKQIYENSGLR
jgi:hypothetical protein